METVACNVCGSVEALQRFDVSDWLFDRPQVRARLVQCRQCGLIYQNPRPTLAEMAEHYLPEYELYAPEPEAAMLSPLLRLAYHYGMFKRGGFVIRYKHAGRLLDVGCATGLFLRAMRTSGAWDVHGVEVAPQVAEIARERFQLDVRTGTLEEAAFPSATFDAITLWDVLEHLPDPAASLRELHRILKPEGVLVLRVPNGASWDAQLFGKYWAGLEPPRHLYVFTAQTLGCLLKQAGFQILQRSTASAAYTTCLLSLRFYLREHGGAFARWLLPLFYHPIMRVLTAPPFYLASLGLRGPLLVIVARRIETETDA